MNCLVLILAIGLAAIYSFVEGLNLKTISHQQNLQGIKSRDLSYLNSPFGFQSRCTDKQKCLKCGGIYDGDDNGRGNPDPDDICNGRQSSQVSCYWFKEADSTNNGAKPSHASSSCPVSYWENPGGSENQSPEPGTYSLDIIYTVGETCQLMMYLERLELDDPTQGYCNDATLKVSGQDFYQSIPVLCGNLAQQSIYVFVGDNPTTPGVVTITITANTNKMKQWRIIVVKLDCCSPLLAPPGCLQYNYLTSGSIVSFNFQSQRSTQNTIQNICYAVCFPQYCQLEIGLLMRNSYFHIGSTWASANGNVSDNNHCDNGKLTIPVNSRNPAYPTSYCGDHLSPVEGSTSSSLVVTYPVTPNMIEICWGPRYDSKNGFQLSYKLTDCLPSPPLPSSECPPCPGHLPATGGKFDPNSASACCGWVKDGHHSCGGCKRYDAPKDSPCHCKYREDCDKNNSPKCGVGYVKC